MGAPLSRRRIAQLTHTDPKRRALAMLEVCPVEWEALAELLRGAGYSCSQVGIMLQDIAVNILRAGVYLETRGRLGDRGSKVLPAHALAVRDQNRAARRVRKVLGYQTTPDINV